MKLLYRMVTFQAHDRFETCINEKNSTSHSKIAKHLARSSLCLTSSYSFGLLTPASHKAVERCCNVFVCSVCSASIHYNNMNFSSDDERRCWPSNEAENGDVNKR
jgi:hypothetical protein